MEQLSLHTHALEQSRTRLIRAGDAERSRLERAIGRHVIPHLAPLPGRLHELTRSDRPGPALLDAAQLELLLESTNAALLSLREITRGVFPAQLARSGLPVALDSLLARPESAGRLTVETAARGLRFDPRVEAAAYFCVAEVARASDDSVDVVLSVHDDRLNLSISGSGGDGLSVSHMRDRVEATGGSVSIDGRDGHAVVDVRAPATGAPSAL